MMKVMRCLVPLNHSIGGGAYCTFDILVSVFMFTAKASKVPYVMATNEALCFNGRITKCYQVKRWLH